MEQKIQELTNKIYNEGIEKAKKEADIILENARKEADKIIEKAKDDAKKIISDAGKEALQIKTKTLSEIKMAGTQSVATLQQEIINLLSKSSISSTVSKSVNDLEFIKTLIKEIITKWDSSAKSLDLELVLPEKFKKELTDFFKTKATDILNKGIEISFENRMSGGFKIGPKDKSFVLSFTETEFIQFFQSFLKPKTKEILFSGE